MNCWMVYYKDSRGFREGQEIIYAHTRKEAISEYERPLLRCSKNKEKDVNKT